MSAMSRDLASAVEQILESKLWTYIIEHEQFCRQMIICGGDGFGGVETLLIRNCLL